MEKLLDWIGLTSILLSIVTCIIVCKAWDLGRDYVYITEIKAKRLNWFEKWLDGFKKFLQI